MKFLKFLAIAAAGLWVFAYFVFPTYTHSYRVTFSVRDHGVVKNGTTVVTKVVRDNQHKPLVQKRYRVCAYGFSPWIDLGDKGLLVIAFNTWTSEAAGFDSQKLPLYSLGELSNVAFMGAKRGAPNLTPETVKEVTSKTGEKLLRNDQMPQFVWFPDPKNRGSARIVHASEFRDALGGDIELISVIVEMPASAENNRSLFEKLPWLKAAMEERGIAAHKTRNLIRSYNLLGQ